MEIATEVSTSTVLVRGVLAWAYPDAFFRDAFDRTCRPRQWNRKLIIAAITRLMLLVVARARRSVFYAYRADRAEDCPTATATATAAAVYAKYGRIDPAYSTELVRGSARRIGPLIEAAGARHLPCWEGYRIRILDGTGLGGTEHRLAPLRRIKAAGLPGRRAAWSPPTTRPPAWLSTSRPPRTPTPPNASRRARWWPRPRRASCPWPTGSTARPRSCSDRPTAGPNS